MNFICLQTGIDVAPLLEKLEQNPYLWREIDIRQKYPGSAHHSTETIFLRGPRSFSERDYFFDLAAIDYPALYKLRDVVLPLVAPVMKKMEAREIGRVMIVKLLPKSWVKWHIDQGMYADYFSRFHIPLQTNADCKFHVADSTSGETIHMGCGEAWWFNHKAPHCATNESDEPRIHLIFDAISPKFPVGGLLLGETR